MKKPFVPKKSVSVSLLVHRRGLARTQRPARLRAKHDLQFHRPENRHQQQPGRDYDVRFRPGIFSVIYGGFAIRRGDVDQGKMSIIGGAIIAAAPAMIYAFFKIFGLDTSSAVGVAPLIDERTGRPN